MQGLIRRTAHPLFLLAGLLLWEFLGRSEAAVPLALMGVLGSMLILERLFPAQPTWVQSRGEKVGLFFAMLALTTLSGVIAVSYAELGDPIFGALRERIDPGFGASPLLVQALALYFVSDLIYYWVHRGIHRFGWLWRLSGHGVHHAFRNLHAVNFGVSHPLEYLLIALPMVLVAGVLGAAPEAVSAATVLLIVNTSLAHSNLDLDAPVVRFFFTNSNHHRLHHSVDLEQSNTNFACNGIVWDRLFGTYAEGAVEQTGIGPRQPSFLELARMPWREPADAKTVATAGQAASN